MFTLHIDVVQLHAYVRYCLELFEADWFDVSRADLFMEELIPQKRYVYLNPRSIFSIPNGNTHLQESAWCTEGTLSSTAS